jgi:hypothetical protein
MNFSKKKTVSAFGFTMIVFFTAGMLSPLFAELGGSSSSVSTDALKFKSSIKKTQSATYTVHEMTDNYGTVIREYVGPDNTVFAVAWEGKRTPNLSQLFGSYHQRYSSRLSAARADKTVGRNRVSLKNSDMVVQSFGHMGFSKGKAYIPDMVPSGFDVEGLE